MTGLRNILLLSLLCLPTLAHADSIASRVQQMVEEFGPFRGLKGAIDNLKEDILNAEQPKPVPLPEENPPEPKNSRGRDLPQAVPESANSSFRPPRQLPLWEPFCFFVHPAIDPNSANISIKRVVDEFGQCGIAVDPYVIPVMPNLPGGVAAVNQLIQAACNINETYNVRGGAVMMSPTAALAADMCNDPNAGGCSTLCDPLAIQHTGPPSPALVLHEVMHGACCGPPCLNEGEGRAPGGPGISVGSAIDLFFDLKIFHAEEGANLQDTGVTPAGCAALREGASPNGLRVMWSPDRQYYYKRPSDPNKGWNLTLRQPYFKPRPPSYGKNEPKEKPPGLGGGTGQLTFDESAPGKNATSSGGTVAVNSDEGDPHKRPAFAGPQNNLITKATIEDATTRDLASVPKETGEGKEGKGLFFDESAKKGEQASKELTGGTTSKSGSNDSQNPTVTSETGAEEGEKKGGLVFDENAAKGEKGSETGESASPAPAGPLGGLLTAGLTPADDLKAKSKLTVKKPKANGKYRRKRGAALRLGKDGKPRNSGLQQRADYLISTRPAPDFTIEPETGEGEGGSND